MQAKLDHVVLWVADPLRSLSFCENVVGLTPVRADEFREGKAPFPSVRVSGDSIIDLMAKVAAPLIDHMVGVPGTAGNLVNHVCIAMSRDDIEALRTRLADNGVTVLPTMTNPFGARGLAPEAFYFRDPDDNVIEARFYE
jgi:catechol 2,3-dioxygenase-like lactoylglutathione lyase family enzyme